MIGKLFWISLTVVFTFGFIVLFENGLDNYADNCKAEFEQVKVYFSQPVKKKADVSDKLQ